MWPISAISSGISGIISGVGGIIDDLVTTDEERLKIALQDRQIEAALMQEQTRTNQAEARHSSIFVAGWRPFIGWVGGFGLAYQFIGYPLLNWAWVFFLAQGWIPPGISSPPVLEFGELMPLILGMLGVGTMRSYDKARNVDTKRMK
jgi:hypothetical protein